MTIETPNIGLIKAESNDFIDFETHFNPNWDKVDEKVGNIKDVVGVSIEDFKIVAPETTDTGRIQRALDSLPNNGFLLFNYGQTYNTNGNTITNKTVSIIANGTTFVQKSNAPIFDVSADWALEENVTTVIDSSYDYSEGDAKLTPVTKLTLASDKSVSLKRGDIIKIMSDDNLPSSTTKKKAEFAMVMSVVGVDVYLNTRVRESYSTNVRIKKLADYSFSLVGGFFDVDPTGDALNWNADLIKISFMRDISIQYPNILKGYGVGISLTSCYNYTIDTPIIKNLRNEPSKSRYGYGINDGSCEGGKVLGGYFANCRHGYTTNASIYGRVAHAIISDCVGYGCSAAPFDTHFECYDITFDSCKAVGTYAGGTSAGAGFQIRGEKVTLNDCTSHACYFGFYVFEQGNDIVLNNCRAYKTRFRALIITPDVLGKVTINGGLYESLAQNDGAVQIVRGNVKINGNPIFKSDRTNGSFGCILNVLDSTLEIDKVTLDFSAANGANDRFITMANSTIRAERIVGYQPQNHVQNSIGGDNTANSKIHVEKVIYDVRPPTTFYQIPSPVYGTIKTWNDATV